MKRSFYIGLFALGMLALSFFATYWMDRNSYQDKAAKRIDPTAVGASAFAEESVRREGPILVGEIEVETPQTQNVRVANPVFWMVVGAGSASLGVFVATRERSSMKRYRG